MRLPRELLDRERPQRTVPELLEENLELRARVGEATRAAENLTGSVVRHSAHNQELRTWVRSLELRTRGIAVLWCGQVFAFGIALGHWWTYRSRGAAVIAIVAGSVSLAGALAETWARHRARAEHPRW